MKKAIFGVLFVAIIASLAFAGIFLCYGYASVGEGWTISCPSISNTGTDITDSDGYFSITRGDVPAGTEYYLKATKTGYIAMYSAIYTFGGSTYGDNLGNVAFHKGLPVE
ncbi:hypothetical protein HZA73_08810 [candidate division TA06 bacterium]|nr:hypothetical protein [candidate division TA06 bacterium]